MSHEDIKSLLGAYALGAVDDVEAQEVRDHLPGCPECSAEFEAMSEAAAAFALAPAPEEFDPALAGRIVDTASGGGARATPQSTAEVTDIRPRRSKVVRVALASGIAALLAAVVVLSLTIVNANQEIDRQNAAIRSLVNSPEGFHLKGLPGVQAAAVPAGGGGERFVVTGLDSAPSGKTYQIWIKKGDRLYGAGTFNTNSGVSVSSMTGPVHGADQILVTIEPDGGSDQPTTNPILSS